MQAGLRCKMSNFWVVTLKTIVLLFLIAGFSTPAKSQNFRLATVGFFFSFFKYFDNFGIGVNKDNNYPLEHTLKMIVCVVRREKYLVSNIYSALTKHSFIL